MHFVYDNCGDHGLLKMHTPPWEFGCNCKLEQITAKRAGKTPTMIRPPTPPEKVHVESKSGYTFDPETVFKEFDFELIKNDVLRKEAKDGVEKLIGTVNEPGAMDVSKDGRFETLGINLQNPDPYPNDQKHKKLRPVYNAIKNESEDAFTSMITQKGKNMRREFIGIYDPEGKPYWIGMGEKGTGAANFPEIPEGCIFIHNHPDGTTFSSADMQSFIECNMTKMVASIQEKNAAGEIKIRQYILTRKKTGDKLTYAAIMQRYEKFFKWKTDFEAWKEALNGTCYEIAFS